MSTHKVKSKILSLTNTRKITQAMEMITAIKMRKLQQRSLKIRDFIENLEEALQILKGDQDLKSPFIEDNDCSKIAFIIISSDRGLCANLNTKLFEVIDQRISKFNQEDILYSFIGSKGFSYYTNKRKIQVVYTQRNLGDMPNIGDIKEVLDLVLDKYIKKEIGSVYVAYNHYVNTMVRIPQVHKILPLQLDRKIENIDISQYLIEPDTNTIFENAASNYISYKIFQSLVDNITCEHAARLVEMKTATDNADSAIKDLTLQYNKERQAAITQNIIEIVSAVEDNQLI